MKTRFAAMLVVACLFTGPAMAQGLGAAAPQPIAAAILFGLALLLAGKRPE